MEKSPKVSVLMSVYNGESFLDQAIDSILGQTFADFEFVIVDDGSTDSTWQILGEYVEEDARVVLLQNRTNQGLAKSLNRGLEIARGEYIARMDADDISLPNRLDAQVSYLDTYAQVGLIGTASEHIDEDGNCLNKAIQHPREHNLILWALCFYTPFVHPSVMFRKQIIENIGGYDESLIVNQDRDLWQRLSSMTHFANLGEVYLLYRKHPASLQKDKEELRVRNSAKASQRMISKVLGYQVDFEICYDIRIRRFEAADQALQVVKLIRLLYQAFMSKFSLFALEKRTIRQDAIRRIYGFARPYWCDGKMRKEFFNFALEVKIIPVVKYLIKRKRQRPWNVIRYI